MQNFYFLHDMSCELYIQFYIMFNLIHRSGREHDVINLAPTGHGKHT